MGATGDEWLTRLKQILLRIREWLDRRRRP